MNPARDTSGWPAHDVVPPVKKMPQASGVGQRVGGLVPSHVVCAEQQTCIDIANAAIRLLEHFRDDVTRGSMVAARHDLRNVEELVRHLRTDWLETFGKLTGCKPELCQRCGEVVEVCDCDDIPFGEA